MAFDAPYKTQFDIWGLIKRAGTVDPYLLTAKYRMNRGVLRRSRGGGAGGLILRRRQSEWRAGSVTQESVNSSSTDLVDLDNTTQDEFDYDAEDDGDKFDPRRTEDDEVSQISYLKACKAYKVKPTSYFYKSLKNDTIRMRHHLIGPEGAKACAVALVSNPKVHTLDLTDNSIGPKGAEYLADTLKENNFIVNLCLADNNMGVEGVKHIVDVIKKLDTMQSLSISANGLRECDAEVIRPLLEDTTSLKHLDLSHNEFRETAGEVIGDGLYNNDTMTSLDLSWNHLRRDGAVFIAEGLADNTCLKTLNLAWNGFYLDGCRALARALEVNTTLTELDLTCNRINKECLEKLMSGLKRNSTLETLRLGLNPLTPAGAMTILNFVNETKTTGIKELDLTDQLVEPSFVALVGEMEAKRPIKVIYGQVRGQEGRGDEDDEKQLMDENPIIVLMEFGKLMGFRLMDLFAALDKDGSKSLDHDEIRSGLRLVNIPLSDKCIEILIHKLDVDGDGEIDFGELMAAQTEHRKKMSKFYAAQEGDVDIEDTEIGRVRIKLSRLMAKKMSGNPAFKRSVEQMREQLISGGEKRLHETLAKTVVDKLQTLPQSPDKDTTKPLTKKSVEDVVGSNGYTGRTDAGSTTTDETCRRTSRVTIRTPDEEEARQSGTCNRHHVDKGAV